MEAGLKMCDGRSVSRTREHARLLLRVCCVLGFAGCTPFPDTPITTDGTVTLKTYGNIATATSRARLACGESRRTPVLMSLSGTGDDETATFGCL
jgi:hypothetical protein